MTINQLWVQDTEYQAADDRLLLAALLPPGNIGPLGSAVGLRKVDDLVLTMTTGFAGVVSRGAAFINFGPSIYLLTNDSNENVTFGPADPTNARIDILVAQVYDVEAGGGAAPPTIRVIAGAVSATPVAPATPAGALLLNSLRYNAGATAPINTRNAATAFPLFPPFPTGYRECTGTAIVTLPANNLTWVQCPTPNLGISGGTGFNNDATSITTTSGGLYDVEVYGVFAGGNAGRRGVGVTIGGAAPPIYQQQVQSCDVGQNLYIGFRTTVLMTQPAGTRISVWCLNDSNAAATVAQRRVFARRVA